MPIFDHQQFEQLFKRYRPELLAFAGHYSGADIAEDLVQEAYLRFMQHAKNNTIENPRAYLYRVTHNLGADYFRYRQVRARHAAEDEVDPKSIIDAAPEPDSAADAQMMLQRCLTALEALPEVYRNVFLLHRIDGMSYAEIGKALQIPTRTIERYCAKALAHCYAEVHGKTTQ